MNPPINSPALCALLTGFLLASCTTSGTQKPERGPAGTIAYEVLIESNEPGARVEVNGDYVGKTPMTLKIFGDRDGTFHDFGSYDYVIQVFPLRPGQQIQTKQFGTGRWWSQEDKIPHRLYFDLDLKAERFSIDPQPPKTDR